MIAWIAILGTIGVATASLGALLAAREQAYTAAEAAALASAVATYPPTGGGSPRSLAVEFANRNGSQVVGCRCPIDASFRSRTVTVITALDVEVPVFGKVTVRAAASSEFDPSLWLGG